jgi:hypothetical protein
MIKMTTKTVQGDKELQTRVLGQDSWSRKARTGHPGGTGKRGQEDQNMTEGQGSRDWTTEMGQPVQP